MYECLFLICVYLLSYRFFRITAVGTINDIKRNLKLFPKHYALPPRWIRKHFKLKKAEVPKFLLFRLYVSLACGILAFATPIIYLLSNFNAIVGGVMAFAPIIYLFPDLVVFFVLSHIFKK